MALIDIIDEYPVFDDSNQARFPRSFKQGDVIQRVVSLARIIHRGGDIGLADVA